MKWLTPGGAVAALGVGIAVAYGLGWRGLVLLFTFFVTASLLTVPGATDARGRTVRQVLANGGVAAIAAAAGWWGAFAGALAAATADTWATELGGRSPETPRLIFTGARVQRGTSGGITIAGTAGGALGAAVIGALGAGLGPRSSQFAEAVVIAGVAGMFADSMLGATLQGRFRCGVCGTEYERRDATCHGSLAPSRGFGWLDNDAVNLVATLAGAGVAGWLARG